MVLERDYIIQKVGPTRDRWLNSYAEARQNNAEVEKRNPGERLYGSRKEYLYINKLGLSGEWAGMVYLSPVEWNYFKTGRIYGLPDLFLRRYTYPIFFRPPGYPPFLDAKTNKTMYDTNYLLVPPNDAREWIYILCYVLDPIPDPERGWQGEPWALVCPTVVMVGWCFGFEAKQDQYWMTDPALGRNYQVPHYDDILRPMKELRVLLDQCRQYGATDGLQRWKQRGGLYVPERYYDQDRHVRKISENDDR